MANHYFHVFPPRNEIFASLHFRHTLCCMCKKNVLLFQIGCEIFPLFHNWKGTIEYTYIFNANWFNSLNWRFDHNCFTFKPLALYHWYDSQLERNQLMIIRIKAKWFLSFVKWNEENCSTNGEYFVPKGCWVRVFFF